MSMTTRLMMLIALMEAFVCVRVPTVQAQDSADSTPPPFSVRWADGLSIESPDGNTKFQVGGLLQIDGRFDVDDPTSTVANTLVLRRIRPIFQGRVWKIFEFRLMPDFGLGTTVIYDAWIDAKLSKGFWVRAGKDKTPLGYEQLLSDYAIVFPERTLVTDLVPNRDVGLQVRGEVAGGHVAYIGGVFNGVPDGNNGDVDTNGAKDVAGRLTVSGGPGLGVAVAGTAGRQNGVLPTFKTGLQRTFFAYTNGAVADGQRSRVSPAGFWYYKSVGAFAEYARSTQGVTKGATHGDIANSGWEVTGLWVVTGEPATERGVLTPSKPYSPGNGQWGALQVAARYGSLTIDEQAFALKMAAAGSSRIAKAAGVDATWYPTPNIKYVFSYERTVFDENSNGPRKPENALVFRIQFNLQPSL
jgi:phosphate-selective porin OprO/OprP